MLKIGKQLRTLRKARGMTQEDVARGIGVAKETISKIETEASEPSADNWAKLADFLGVSTDALRDPREPVVAPAPSELEAGLIDAARRAQGGSPHALAEMRRILDELTKSDVARVSAAASRPTRKRGT